MAERARKKAADAAQLREKAERSAKAEVKKGKDEEKDGKSEEARADAKEKGEIYVPSSKLKRVYPQGLI